MAEVQVPAFAVTPRSPKAMTCQVGTNGEFEVTWNGNSVKMQRDQFVATMRPRGVEAKTICKLMGIEFTTPRGEDENS